MVRLKMAQTIREAITLIEQGRTCDRSPTCFSHIYGERPSCAPGLGCRNYTDVRVGPETVTDPAFLVTRSFEDMVTWVDTSKIKFVLWLPAVM